MAFPFRRSRTRTSAPVRRTLRASAQKITLDDKKRLTAEWNRRQEWQDEAWAYFDDVPEIKYAVWYEGNVMAKARFFVAWNNPDDPEADPIPISDPTAIAALGAELVAAAEAEWARLTGPLGGKSEIQRELNMNLEVAGEAYIVGIGGRDEVLDLLGNVKTPAVAESWDVRSVSEVDRQGDTVKIKSASDDQSPQTLDPKRDTIIRVWQRHPRWSMQPDCNMRGVLSECEALTLLSNEVKAEAKSRMSAGILTLPNELGTGADGSETEPDDGDEAQNDPLEEEIYSAVTDPIEDPSSAAAVAPLILRGPADYLKPDFVRLISFARDSSKELEPRIAARVDRIARGLNLPPEIVLGHQETTFTNAQQIEEDVYTKHFQPRCVLMADAFAIGFLLPQLLDPGESGLPRFKPEDVENVVVWFDPSDMVKQNDPLQSATEALNLDVISEESYRRYKGFSEDDAPDPTERLIRTVLHLRTFDPGVSTAILDLMGVELDIPEVLPGTATTSTDSAAGARRSRDAVLAALIARAGRENTPAGDDLYAAVARMLTDDGAKGLAGARRGRARPALTSARAERNVGYKLMEIDRDLRARLRAAADAAMSRVLERAGNRAKQKIASTAAGREWLSTATGTPAAEVCRSLPRALRAAMALADDDLVPAESWDQLEAQFLEWGANAQKQALKLVKKVVGMTEHSASELESRQFANLGEAWSWMRDSLHDLAVAGLYGPEPLAPTIGEFDPTAKVPTGLVRQALARAGGANGITIENGNPYVALQDGDTPLGGIATGTDIMDAATSDGALVEGYEWVYGPAFRAAPFEDHEALDGEVFSSFESDVLAGSPFGDFYYPGDHDGCVCDVAPVLLAPEDLGEGE